MFRTWTRTDGQLAAACTRCGATTATTVPAKRDQWRKNHACPEPEAA